MQNLQNTAGFGIAKRECICHNGRMNKFLLALFLFFASLLAFPAPAQEETEEETLAAIPAILKDVKLVNKAKPNLKARIYFVYQSRSTCSICVSEAPTLVKEYKKMKRKGCEMVMLNIDSSPERAAAWAKRAKMDFPIISPEVSMSCRMPWEYAGRPLLPCMVAMTPDGTKLAEASGSEVGELVKDWKKMLRELDKQEARTAAAEAREKAKEERKKAREKKRKAEEEEEESRREDDKTIPTFKPLKR